MIFARLCTCRREGRVYRSTCVCARGSIFFFDARVSSSRGLYVAWRFVEILFLKNKKKKKTAEIPVETRA